jgi:hypothetical protein
MLVTEKRTAAVKKTPGARPSESPRASTSDRLTKTKFQGVSNVYSSVARFLTRPGEYESSSRLQVTTSTIHGHRDGNSESRIPLHASGIRDTVWVLSPPNLHNRTNAPKCQPSLPSRSRTAQNGQKAEANSPSSARSGVHICLIFPTFTYLSYFAYFRAYFCIFR